MQESVVLRRLGSISVRQFMRAYWQRKPLLIRNALPSLTLTIDRAQLFDLARDANVESRLITSFNGRWTLQHGPLPRLPSTRRTGWTLLVQGIDLHDDSARDVLSRFRFIPDARLDDLMVSFATDGGGVGPHVDSYDVFLLQASGRRRWRISSQRDLRVRRGAPIRVVEGFRASHEWILNAGDMLYLPPGVVHEGTAVGECITYSIGFRAATYQELLEPWYFDYAEHAQVRGRYGDAGARVMRSPASLPPAMVRGIHAKLARSKPSIADTERFLLRYLTEPKATVIFDAPKRRLSLGDFRARAKQRGLKLARRTRLIYSSNAVAINGEWMKLPRAASSVIKALANQRALTLQDKSPPETAWGLLHDWYAAGWLALGD